MPDDRRNKGPYNGTLYRGITHGETVEVVQVKSITKQLINGVQQDVVLPVSEDQLPVPVIADLLPGAKDDVDGKYCVITYQDNSLHALDFKNIELLHASELSDRYISLDNWSHIRTPLYRPVKVEGPVYAFLIKDIQPALTSKEGEHVTQYIITPHDDTLRPVIVDEAIINKYGPMIGEYFLQDKETGEQSIMFRSAFENRYEVIKN